MKGKLKFFVSMVMAVCLLAGVLPVQTKVSAESRDIWQTSGKYTISASKLVTKCKLYSAYSSKKKKVRIYRMTAKTKIQDGGAGKVLTGKKRKQMIKRLNKKNEPIQFKAKNGVLVFVWYNV